MLHGWGIFSAVYSSQLPTSRQFISFYPSPLYLFEYTNRKLRIQSLPMSKNICIIEAGLAGSIIAQNPAQVGHKITLVDMGDQPKYLEPDDDD